MILVTIVQHSPRWTPVVLQLDPTDCEKKTNCYIRHYWEIAAFPIHIQWHPLWSSCDSCRPSWRRQSFQTYSATEIETRSNFWSAQSVWRCGCQTVIGHQHIHSELRPAVVPFMLITWDPAAPHSCWVSKQHHIRCDKWLELLQGRAMHTVKSPSALATVYQHQGMPLGQSKCLVSGDLYNSH